MDCVFCEIIAKKSPADIIYEDKDTIVFKSIAPKAPLHLLILPKKHILSIDHLELADKELTGKMILVAQKIARKQKIAPFCRGGDEQGGYKLVFNVGSGGGQIINHLHLHLLGGWQTKKERDTSGLP